MYICEQMYMSICNKEGNTQISILLFQKERHLIVLSIWITLGEDLIISLQKIMDNKVFYSCFALGEKTDVQYYVLLFALAKPGG